MNEQPDSKKWDEPSTPEEWQTAADGAKGMLVLAAAQKYGLVTGGPRGPLMLIARRGNIDRCEELLRRAAERGIKPRPDAVEHFVMMCHLLVKGGADA